MCNTTSVSGLLVFSLQMEEEANWINQCKKYQSLTLRYFCTKYAEQIFFEGLNLHVLLLDTNCSDFTLKSKSLLSVSELLLNQKSNEVIHSEE